MRTPPRAVAGFVDAAGIGGLGLRRAGEWLKRARRGAALARGGVKRGDAVGQQQIGKAVSGKVMHPLAQHMALRSQPPQGEPGQRPGGQVHGRLRLGPERGLDRCGIAAGHVAMEQTGRGGGVGPLLRCAIRSRCDAQRQGVGLRHHLRHGPRQPRDIQRPVQPQRLPGIEDRASRRGALRKPDPLLRRTERHAGGGSGIGADRAHSQAACARATMSHHAARVSCSMNSV